MYLATRPHVAHLSVTWDRGGGGKSPGERSMGPEQDGQLSGVPVLSLAIRFSACAGLYVAGGGFLILYQHQQKNDPEIRLRYAKYT
jgi:hypothetical protein